MPELSRFHGIIIRMYSEPGAGHHASHFHAYYQGNTAVFTIYPIVMIAGFLPLRQQRLVEAWAELHQDELKVGWHRLINGCAASPIKPLE